MSEGTMQTELSRAAAIVKALSAGIRAAGGEPNYDLMRIASQKGLADQLGQAVMDELFVCLHSFNLTIGWNNCLTDMFANNTQRWETDWECAEKFGQKALEFFSTHGKDEVAGQTFRYHLMQVQREMHAQEVYQRIGSGNDWPYAMELVEVAEHLPKGLVGKFIGMPWAQYEGWVPAVKVKRGSKLKFIMHSRMTVYKAGCVFLRRTPVN